MAAERSSELGEREPQSTLSELLAELAMAGVTPLPEEEVRAQLEQLPRGLTAILTLDFVCGLRASRQRDGSFIVSTTNGLEDPEHPIAKQFRFREFTL